VNAPNCLCNRFHRRQRAALAREGNVVRFGLPISSGSLCGRPRFLEPSADTINSVKLLVSSSLMISLCLSLSRKEIYSN